MKVFPPIDTISDQAHAMLNQVSALQELMTLELPGEFIFSPPFTNRIKVHTLEELHLARTILRENFGWKDKLRNKWFSCGSVLVSFEPEKDVQLPLPFEIWVAGPPDTFPRELLGDCKLVPVTASQEFYIQCPIKGDDF